MASKGNKFQREMRTKLAECNKLVKSYNESLEFAEFKKMVGIRNKINEVLAEYNANAQSAKFEELGKAADPMKQACIEMYYLGARVKDDPNAPKDAPAKPLVIDTNVSTAIDLKSLHDHVKDGIGADHLWVTYVEHLNRRYSETAEDEIGGDRKRIRENAKMSKAAAAIADPFEGKTDIEATQMVLDMMLGAGYTIDQHMVNALKMRHTKADNKDVMKIKANTPKGMRLSMMAVAHAAITGDMFVLDVKQAKKKNATAAAPAEAA